MPKDKGLKNINVFYSTFTNIFILSCFLTFFKFFFWNVFFIYGTVLISYSIFVNKLLNLALFC